MMRGFRRGIALAVAVGIPVAAYAHEYIVKPAAPVLTRLGWPESLRQQNLAPRGREDVPDGLLFKGNPAKRQANTFPQEWRRYEFGLAVIESKRWRRPPPPRSTTGKVE